MLNMTNLRYKKNLSPAMPSPMGAGWAVFLLGLSMILSAALAPVKRRIRRIEARLVWFWTGYITYDRDMANMAWVGTLYCLITGTGLIYAIGRQVFHTYPWFCDHFMQ